MINNNNVSKEQMCGRCGKCVASFKGREGAQLPVTGRADEQQQQQRRKV